MSLPPNSKLNVPWLMGLMRTGPADVSSVSVTAGFVAVGASEADGAGAGVAAATDADGEDDGAEFGTGVFSHESASTQGTIQMSFMAGA